MPEKLCIGCRRIHIPVGAQRCPDCSREYERARRQRRGTRQQRGYTELFYKLVRAAIAAHPYCADCGTSECLTGDHIPLSRGGTNVAHNIRVLCLSCNSSRGNRTFPSQVLSSFEQARCIRDDDTPLIA